MGLCAAGVPVPCAVPLAGRRPGVARRENSRPHRRYLAVTTSPAAPSSLLSLLLAPKPLKPGLFSVFVKARLSLKLSGVIESQTVLGIRLSVVSGWQVHLSRPHLPLPFGPSGLADALLCC